MVNPLLLLPLLNASALMTIKDGCYEQNPATQPQLIPTTYIVCSQAIHHIALGRTLDTPVVFGRSVKVGHTVPDQFVHRGFYGSCVIKIDMIDGEQDTLTWRDIIDSASELRDTCVAPPPHLGGEGKAGPRKLLAVSVFGASNEDVGFVGPGGKPVISGSSTS